MHLANQELLIIGGSSGIGLELARRALSEDAKVVISGRSAERLRDAKAQLNGAFVETMQCDIGSQEQVEAMFRAIGDLDHLIVTAADLPYGPLEALTESDLMRAVRSKFLGLFFAAQQAASRLRTGGSITFTSGIATQRPMRGEQPPLRSTEQWRDSDAHSL
jgi:NAD(P)-dependent dehydrogenase (short-subunit alcohol dehydrogenase family)